MHAVCEARPLGTQPLYAYLIDLEKAFRVIELDLMCYSLLGNNPTTWLIQTVHNHLLAAILAYTKTYDGLAVTSKVNL